MKTSTYISIIKLFLILVLFKCPFDLAGQRNGELQNKIYFDSKDFLYPMVEKKFASIMIGSINTAEENIFYLPVSATGLTNYKIGYCIIGWKIITASIAGGRNRSYSGPYFIAMDISTLYLFNSSIVQELYHRRKRSFHMAKDITNLNMRPISKIMENLPKNISFDFATMKGHLFLATLNENRLKIWKYKNIEGDFLRYPDNKTVTKSRLEKYKPIILYDSNVSFNGEIVVFSLNRKLFIYSNEIDELYTFNSDHLIKVSEFEKYKDQKPDNFSFAINNIDNQLFVVPKHQLLKSKLPFNEFLKKHAIEIIIN